MSRTRKTKEPEARKPDLPSPFSPPSEEPICPYKFIKELSEANRNLVETMEQLIDEHEKAVQWCENFREMAATLSKQATYWRDIAREKDTAIKHREDRIQQLERAIDTALSLIRSGAPNLTKSPLFYQVCACIETYRKPRNAN